MSDNVTVTFKFKDKVDAEKWNDIVKAKGKKPRLRDKDVSVSVPFGKLYRFVTPFENLW